MRKMLEKKVSMILDATPDQLVRDTEYSCPLEFWTDHISAGGTDKEYHDKDLAKTWNTIEEMIVIAHETLKETVNR